MNKTVFVVISFVIGSIFGFPMYAHTVTMMPNNNNMMGNNRGMRTSMDQHFIEQMIPHHQSAIDMARLALEKSKKPEIKNLAEDIIDSQSKEIDNMRGWYREWYNKEVPTNTTAMGMMMGNRMGGGMMCGQADTEALKQANDFDKMFVEQMIPHHQMAIMMAQMLESGTARPEMKQLAKNIIESQSRETEQMQDWYNEWNK